MSVSRITINQQKEKKRRNGRQKTMVDQRNVLRLIVGMCKRISLLPKRRNAKIQEILSRKDCMKKRSYLVMNDGIYVNFFLNDMSFETYYSFLSTAHASTCFGNVLFRLIVRGVKIIISVIVLFFLLNLDLVGVFSWRRF